MPFQTLISLSNIQSDLKLLPADIIFLVKGLRNWLDFLDFLSVSRRNLLAYSRRPSSGCGEAVESAPGIFRGREFDPHCYHRASTLPWRSPTGCSVYCARGSQNRQERNVPPWDGSQSGLDRRTAGPELASKQWALLRPRARWKAHDL